MVEKVDVDGLNLLYNTSRRYKKFGKTSKQLNCTVSVIIIKKSNLQAKFMF